MGDYNDAFMRGNNAAVQARTKQQNRANLMQMKLIGQSHPTGLTNNLLKLFEPRPPLEYKPPPEKRKCPPYTGMAQFVSSFAEPTDPEYAPPVEKGETPGQKKARIHQLRLEEGAKKAAEELEKYDPNSDPNISGDPYKTLFVANLNYETTESRIKREFEAYGPIKRVRLIADKETNKPRGYAFIEYMHTRDMKAAYKQADGRKLDNRRVLVDVERGRTVPNWRPRRLGGGLGTSRVGGEEVNQKNSGREQQQSGGATRSVEPRAQEEREHREKSREQVKEREREKSRERSHDRPRDREHREDRHHRDRDRKSDRGDRDRDRSGRDRDRHRDRDRSGRDRDRSGRDRDRHREKDREGDVEHIDRDRGRSRDKDYDYERVDRHERDKHEDRQKSYDHGDQEEWYDQPEHGGDKRVDPERDLGGYDYYDQERYNHQDDDHDRYGQMEEDNYEGGKLDTRDKDRDREYRRSDRSLSREYEY
ncbi:putative U1 small nuclear ribonucleoprotein 70kDa [Helianthus annuus]|nr:putative U1 small nuclear ribonucleoprotein 70kDa [Helianthus annuus]